jgi:hypothetical protein
MEDIVPCDGKVGQWGQDVYLNLMRFTCSLCLK